MSRCCDSASSLAGFQAKEIFERSRLPIDLLEKIWNLADTQQSGVLRLPDFVVAMHLLTSLKAGAMRALPPLLPPALYEAAGRMIEARTSASPGSSQRPFDPSYPAAIPRQFSGQGPHLTPSQTGAASLGSRPLSAQSTGGGWVISPADKAQFDTIFASVDKAGRGFITGDDAVRFFGGSKLPPDILAQIWDLACIKGDGKLSKDEFAVAMYLIRQQRAARDGGNTLPETLPPNLVPPSMRPGSRPIDQPVPPGLEALPPPPPPQQPATRSATEDLFGLDALDEPAPVQAHSTGGSTPVNRGSKSPASVVSPAESTPRQPQHAAVFKPFVPTSSFGQNMVVAHVTGGSAVSNRSHARTARSTTPSGPAADDLLGDNDPEVSKKLTAETTELANLSNQVGNLSQQMQEVKSKKSSAEAELSSATARKRNFETRLARLRTVYEQEVEAVRGLEERLNTCRDDNKKLTREIAMIEGTYEDLQHQHRQAIGALEADRQENSRLRDKIRSVGADADKLRPQLEKIKSEARQAKGLVAINKKQLTTTEGERDKLQEEMRETSLAVEALSLETAVPEQAPQSAPAGPSPAPSTMSQSTNPFARVPQTPASETPLSPAAGMPETAAAFDQHASTFDDLFGPSYATQQSPGLPPPPTSFAAQAGDGQSNDARASATALPPAPRSEAPSAAAAEPAPAASAQMSPSSPSPGGGSNAPNFLGPLPNVSSSIGPFDTASNGSAKKAPTSYDGNAQPSAPTPDERDVDVERSKSSLFFGTPSSDRDPIPGAFPGEFSTPMVHTPAEEWSAAEVSKEHGKTVELDRRLSTEGPARDDFDAAFAGFDAPSRSQTGQANGAAHGGPGKSPLAGSAEFDRTFPPLEEIGAAGSSDSSSDHRFDDDFTPVSAKPNEARDHKTNDDTAGPDAAEATEPPTMPRSLSGAASKGIGDASSADRFFPPSNAQASSRTDSFSPPDAGSPSFHSATSDGHAPSGSEQAGPASADATKPSTGSSFAPFLASFFSGSKPPASTEGGQLTPSSPPQSAPSRNEQAPTSAAAATVAPPTATKAVTSPPSPHPPTQTQSLQSSRAGAEAGPDEFDDAFNDLADARESDDKDGNGLGLSGAQSDHLNDFDLAFDSPAASTTTAATTSGAQHQHQHQHQHGSSVHA